MITLLKIGSSNRVSKAERKSPDGPARTLDESQDDAKKTALKQSAVRYLIVGFSSAAIEILLFTVFYYALHIDVVVSNVCAITIATIYNFTLSRKWTFQSVSSLPRSVVLYLLLFTWNQFFSSWAIVVLVDLGFIALFAKVITMGIIVCWNFWLYRKVVFK